MKKCILTILVLVVFLIPCTARAVYQLEVLQVGKSQPFEEAYQAILSGLEKNGLSLGNDVKINRTIIDINSTEEVYTWENLRILMRVKITAGQIIKRKPDLIITIGTPATRYAQLKIVQAGIPLVFTCVEVPELVGCASKTQAGPGFTGVSIYTDPKEVIRISRIGLPKMRKLGMIYSDDNDAVAYADDMKKKAAELGIEIVSRQVNLWERISPAAEEMISQGVEAFLIPADRYYSVKNSENSKAIARISMERKIPCISAVTENVKGSLITIAQDFTGIGYLTADISAKILKDKTLPEKIPIGGKPDLRVIVDIEASKKLDIELPLQILQIATPDSPAPHKQI